MTLSFKVGSFTKSGSTGTQAITGVGFTPKAVILLSTTDTALNSFGSDAAMYFGFAANTTAANQRSFGIYSYDAGSTSDVDTNYHISSVWSDGVPNIFDVIGSISALGSDGFTINWTTNDINYVYEMTYIAIGGSDITNASCGSFNAPAVTGNNAVTGVGFMPELVFLLGTGMTSNNTVSDTQGNFSFGFFNAAGEQAVTSEIIVNGSANMDTARYQRTDTCLAMHSDTASHTHLSAFTSMDSDGFTLNYSSASVANKRVVYLALKGLSSKIGSFTSPTAGTAPISQSVTGLDFAPRGVIFQSAGNIVDTVIETHTRYSIGAANSSSSEICNWIGDEDATASTQNATMMDNDAVIRVSDEASSAGSTTTQALADFTSNDADGFTVNWSVRGTSNAYEILYLAIGDAQVAVVTEQPVKRSFSMSTPTGLEVRTKKRYITSSMI